MPGEFWSRQSSLSSHSPQKSCPCVKDALGSLPSEHQTPETHGCSGSEECLIASFLQVLLLDEPTAGLDPLSRHQVWSLLREQRAGRVLLFSTQFMDEADILAGEHCLHLGQPWGVTLEHKAPKKGQCVAVFLCSALEIPLASPFSRPQGFYLAREAEVCRLFSVPEEKMGDLLSFKVSP